MNKAMGTILVVLAFAANVALAVKPVTVTHSAAADFAGATARNIVIRGDGVVALGPAVSTLPDLPQDVALVSAVTVSPDGRLFIGTAPNAQVLEVFPDAPAQFIASLDGVLVTQLTAGDGYLLASTAGRQGALHRINLAPQPQPSQAITLWTAPQDSAVWGFAREGRTIYVATSDEGNVYALNDQGDAELLFSANQKILRSILFAHGRLYVGTADDGIVYQIDPRAKTSRVLLDADEKEIVKLVADPQGNIFVAASNGGGNGSVSSSARSTSSRSPEDSPGIAHNLAAAPDLDEAGSSPEQPTTRQTRPNMTQPASRPTPQRSAGAAFAAEDSPTGHTVYCISPEGFVRTVARLPVPMLDMLMVDESSPMLYIAASGAGHIYQIQLHDPTIAALAELDPLHVTALTRSADGTIYAGTGAPASVAELSASLASDGELLSKPIDAAQIARWGRLNIHALIPNDASLTVATRTGNMAEPSDDTWSSWSAEQPVSEAWLPIGSPAGRFLQYRLSFAHSAGQSPAVRRVDVLHQVENLPPAVRTIEIQPSPSPDKSRGEPQNNHPRLHRIIQFAAVDPNGDTLQYDLFVRRHGTESWIRIAKEVREPQFPWNAQLFPDGRYEVKVLASDLPDNSPAQALTDEKISAPFLVDNTPPVITEILVRPAGQGSVNLSVNVRDASSRIQRVEYYLNSAEQPTLMAAADGIYDSLEELATGTILDLPPGLNVITVRAYDEFGNLAAGIVEVRIPNPDATTAP